MTPEEALTSFARGLMEAALAHRAQPVAQRRIRPRRSQRPRGGGRIASPASPPPIVEHPEFQEPLPWDGSPIPPVMTPEMLAEMEATLAGTPVPGTRIPGSDDDKQGGARL